MNPCGATRSEKGRQLIELYASMAQNGYNTTDEQHIDHAFNDMEMRAYAAQIRAMLQVLQAETMLDFGCGGSDYELPGFDGQLSAREYLGLREVYRYEPARGIDQRQPADAVLCFDVLEHLFIADMAATVRELFSLARKLLVVNVACYEARAMLPNGENAHITVRAPLWWKGFFDAIAIEYPGVHVCLMCSVGWRNASLFPIWSGEDWINSPTFVTSN